MRSKLNNQYLRASEDRLTRISSARTFEPKNYENLRLRL